MPRLKCANCGQKKSEFMVCKVCASRYCKDCLMEAIRTWPDIVRECARKDVEPLLRDSALLKLRTYPGKRGTNIRGCCIMRAERYVIEHLELEELPLLMTYPWHSGGLEALTKRLESL